MMDDKELLELAAKEAGIQGEYVESMAGNGINQSREIPCPYAATYKGQYDNHRFFKTAVWNPLTDDGDALRLAVKLGGGLEMVIAGHTTAILRHDLLEQVCESDTDQYAATRRAIVRAAAEIGKTL